MDSSLVKLCGLGLLAGLLALAVWRDVASFKIPNALVYGGAAAALALHGVAGEGLPFAVAGLAVGLAAMLPLYLIGAAGAGDVKLMAMVGAFLGPVEGFGAALASYLAGMLLALVAMARPAVFGSAMRNLRLISYSVFARAAGMPAPAFNAQSGSAAKLPYGVAIAAGSLAWAGWRTWS